MSWYDKAVFYHIYPLGLCGAPKQNDGGEVVERMAVLKQWIPHILETGCNAVYLGPVFESVGHGYETTDYKTVDRRLGTNETLKEFVAACHENGIHVILDGVFNHSGRRFFAFEDIQKNRENSKYINWYCNINFGGNNEYNDGFSYDNWGGYNLMVKFNQRNPEVSDYLCDVIRFWVKEFDIDGLRLDAADVLDFDFMKKLRQLANEVKPEFWLMGEVIHGDYSRWVNQETLHSVTNYQLHKALYSGHNDYNYFEIAHNVKYVYGQLANSGGSLELYSFVDNHDVNRLASKVTNKAHLIPIYMLLYTLPGIPSLYYGSEFGIEGIKENGSDDGIRPEIKIEDIDKMDQSLMKLLGQLGKLRQESDALACGKYEERMLTNRQYAFARVSDADSVLVVVNNDEKEVSVSLEIRSGGEEVLDILSGEKVKVENGRINVTLAPCSGKIFRTI